MTAIKTWRRRKAYEWHLDKIERLEKLHMGSSEKQWKLILSHQAALIALTAPVKAKS